MAYKFQIGQAALSGALEQAGEITFLNGKGPDGENITRLKNLVVLEDGNVDVPRHNGTIGLMLGGTAVTAIASELNLLDTAAAGTVVNSKGVIYGAQGQVNGTSLSASTGITGSSLQVGLYGLTNNGRLAIDSFNANWTNVGRTVADLGTVTTMDLNGGSIDGTAIGAAAHSTGKFTTMIATGDVDLGDAVSDTITATGRFDSALVPSTDSTRDLGTSALRWSTIYVDSIVGADISLDTEQYGAAPLGSVISGAVDFALIKSGSTTGLGGAIYTLPTCVVGKVLHVKLSGSQANVTIKAATDDSIEDGAAAGSIYLESTGSAVTLVGMDATHWFII